MTINEQQPEYGRIPEACRRYGLSRTRLYLLAGEGLVRFVKVGNATLVDLGIRRDLSGKSSLAASDPRAESRLKRNRRPRGGADDTDALLVGDNYKIRDLAAAAKGFLHLDCPDESYDPYGSRAPACRRRLRDLPLQP